MRKGDEAMGMSSKRLIRPSIHWDAQHSAEPGSPTVQSPHVLPTPSRLKRSQRGRFDERDVARPHFIDGRVAEPSDVRPDRRGVP